MPSFDDDLLAAAPPEEVWKLLYDPGWFPAWWAGVGSVTEPTDATDDEPATYVLYPEGYPDYPMPQQLETTSGPSGRGVVVSCLVSYLRFTWTLEASGDDTRISVHVELPDEEAHRLDTQRDLIHRSLANLAGLAQQRA